MNTFNKKYSLDLCMEREKSFCMVDCPFHVDIVSLLDKTKRKRWNSAYDDLKNCMAFPELICKICDQKCVSRCPHKNTGDAIKVREIEKYIIKRAGEKKPIQYNLPKKKERVAIIGAGISGMACALRLVEKNYSVTIYEKTSQIGGTIVNLLDKTFVSESILKQFVTKPEIVFNYEVKSIEEKIQLFDAVYIATGKKGSQLGTLIKEGIKSDKKGIYFGGELRNVDIIQACKDGIEAAKAIEAYIKTGKDTYAYEQIETRLKPSMIEVNTYSESYIIENQLDENTVIREAERCLKCKCDACVKACDLLKYFGKPLLKVMEEVRATTEVKGVLGENMTIATKMIALCDQCGKCSEVCPEKIDLKKVFFDSKCSLHKRGELPWAFYEDYIKDMSRANNLYDLIVYPKEKDKIEKIFFPGCQLGALNYKYVIKGYEELKREHKNIALVVRCCGMPAEKAGDRVLQHNAISEFAEIWDGMGKPEVVFACPGCFNAITQEIKDMRASFIYDYIDL